MNPFFRHIAVLAGGTAAGHAIALLASPLLSRLYTPEDFGVLAIYSALLSLLTVVACWRYELAIPISEDDQTACHLLALAALVTGGMSGAAVLAVWWWGDTIAMWAGNEPARPYLWLLPPGMFLAGINVALTYWATRAGAFGLIARTKANQRLSQAAAQLALGFAQSTPLGLVAGEVAGRAGGSTTLLAYTVRRHKDLLAGVTWAGILRAAARYRKFPLLSGASALLNSAGLQAPPLLLSALYGPGVAGALALGYRAVQAPMMLIGHSVAQVYYAEASRLAQTDPPALERLFRRTTGHLLLLGALPAAALALAGAPLFAWVFGDSWREAGRYVQWLSLTFLADFAVFPVASTLTALQRQDWQLGWDAGRLALVVASLTVPPALGWPARTAVALYGLALLVGYTSLWALALAAIRRLQRKEAGPDGS